MEGFALYPTRESPEGAKRKSFHQAPLPLERIRTLRSGASSQEETQPNSPVSQKLLVGIVELSLEKSKADPCLVIRIIVLLRSRRPDRGLPAIASSDPFVRSFFVCTKPLVESNPVPQDPISAVHLPFIYVGDVASSMSFGLCRSKMKNGIVALHSPPMQKDAAEKNGTLPALGASTTDMSSACVKICSRRAGRSARQELLPASVAVAAKLTEEGGGEGWEKSNGLKLSQNWKRFDSSLMLLIQERKAHARNES
ncbi:hypothetical protein HAX54_028780 [Datura stramonium]|uniref:Uncharacterized protein n=1 Tax=Datura stramonium TaxID=4076 RepID=A0ABS8S9V3_DATST|nr:hypothetical protein [Datura stramonium]